MILIHVLVRVGVHVCSHHLVHYSPCLQTRNLDETTRFGCVSLRLWFVLLGCALGVLWVGWSWPWACCCCLCWHWPRRACAGIWLFASLAVGGCGRAPSYLCRCAPCHLASQTWILSRPRPELPCAVAICTGARACFPLPRPEGLHCRGSGECRRPRPMATAACWSATELRLALALGHIRALGTRSSLHRTCLSTRCIYEISPEVEVVQAHTPREEDMHERQRGPVGLKTCSFVPVNRMLRYTGAAMRQLWSTRMAKGEMVMWVEMTLWRA
jgi:hypothetical protein